MEPSFFKETPKFKTPEEELDYLRAHVARREEELKRGGHIEAEHQAVDCALGRAGREHASDPATDREWLVLVE